MSDETDSSREQSREPEAKEGKSEEVFEVERILEHEVQGHKKLIFKVRWAGYDESEDTWEPEEDLQECAKKVVREYYKKMGVQNGAELIKKQKGTPKKQGTPKRQGTPKQQETPNKKHSSRSNPKKRDRSPSSGEETTDVDSDSSDSKKSSKKSKKQRSSKPSPSVASTTPRVPTKAALKAYSQHTPAKASSTTSVPRQKAQERRTVMWETSDDDDEDEQPEASEIDKIASKVKPVQTPVKTQATNEVRTPDSSVVRKEPSPIPQTESPVHAYAESNGSPREVVNGHGKSPSTSSKNKKEDWIVDGIAKRTNNGSEEKLVLVTSSVSGDRKVLNCEEAFKLCGWSLTEYLLHHCEF